MWLGLKIDDTSVICKHVGVFKQVQSPSFQSKYNSQCFSFHDSVINFCRRKLPACISHWVPVVVILLRENSSKRHVTCVSVNSERLRYISKMQNRGGYQRKLDIFKGLLPLFTPGEYAMYSSYLIQRFSQLSTVTNKSSKIIGKSQETPHLAFIPRNGPIFNSLKFLSIWSDCASGDAMSEIKFFSCTKETYRRSAVQLMLPKCFKYQVYMFNVFLPVLTENQYVVKKNHDKLTQVWSKDIIASDNVFGCSRIAS